MLKKVKEVFSRITKASIVDEKLIEEVIREIQRILITSDVNIRLVQELSKKIRERALKEELPPGLSRKEHLIRILYDELVEILGGERYNPKLEPHKILLVGLYGSGKTTTAAKLAKFYSKRGLKTCILTTDTWRPAAYEQLKQLGEEIKIPVFGAPEEKNALDIIKKIQPELKKYEVVIIDSAGRDSLNEELIEEIKSIAAELKPEEIFLVISADIGQTALKQAEKFKESIGLTGVIVTKADASGKAGGALTACHVAGVPVAFIGTGEKLDEFEVFNAEKFVARILGFPDLGALLKKAQEVVEETEFNPEDLLKEKYTLKTFYKQLEATRKMGPLKKVLEMLGVQSMPQDLIETSEEKLKKFKYIMDSMTKEELENPEIIKASRIKRIAKGSGTTESEVKELLKQYEMSKKMLNKIKKGKMKNMKALMKRFQLSGF